MFYMRYLLLISTVFLFTVANAQNLDFPYQLNKWDYFIVPLGLGTEALAWSIENKQTQLTYANLLTLSRTDINKFDQSATRNWNNSLDKLSDVGKYSLVVSPAIILAGSIKQKQWSNTITYGVMYFEVALLTTGLTDLTKVLTKRERPYLYNSHLSEQEKLELINDEGGQDSFFSGTTSISFASAVFLSKTFTDIYGKGTWSRIVWGTSLTLASATAYMRYESGQHFPSDIIVGAAVGSAIGYFIPLLHKKSNKLKNTTFIVLPNYATLAYKF